MKWTAIRTIWSHGDAPGGGHQVGLGGVTRITRFNVRGQSGLVPWYRVFVGEHVRAEVNAAFIAQIRYAEPAEGDRGG